MMQNKAIFLIYSGIISCLKADVLILEGALQNVTVGQLTVAAPPVVNSTRLEAVATPQPGSTSTKLTKENINDVLDGHLAKLKENGMIKDPMIIKQINLNTGLLKVSVFDGEVRGFSTMKRTGKCNLKTNGNGTSVLKIRVGLVSLKLKAKFRIPGFDKYKPYDLRTTTDEVDTRAVIRLVKKDQKTTPHVTKFHLLKMEGLKFWKVGKDQHISHTLFNIFQKTFTKMFKKIILAIIKEIVLILVKQMI